MTRPKSRAILAASLTFIALLAGILAAPVSAAPPAAGAAPPVSETWRPTGNMLVPREGGGVGNGTQAVVLPGGKVLMAGGYNTESTMGVFTFASSANYLADAETYDPATGTWTVTSSMSQTRFAPAMALMGNGKVLVAGGYGGGFGQGVFRNSAEIYDPATRRWTPTTSMRDCRLQATTTVLNSGKILVVGGTGCTGGSQNTAEIYDPATASWSVTANMANPRAAHSATLLADGRVLVVGGRSTNGVVDTIWNSAEIFNPVGGTWTNVGFLNTGRSFHTSGRLPNGKVLVAGGYCQNQTAVGPSPSLASGCVTDTAELFDPATGTWSSVQSLSVKRVFAAATMLPSGKFLVAGGSGLRSAETFDQTTNMWSVVGQMGNVHDDAPLIPLGTGDILIAGGFRATGMTDYRATRASELYRP